MLRQKHPIRGLIYMSKAVAIEKDFEKGKAIMVLLTAGDPSIEDTGKFIIELDRAGVD